MADGAVNNASGATPDVVKGFNMIYAYIGLGVLVIAGAGYVYFTQKPKSAADASTEREAEANKAQNKPSSTASSTPAAPVTPDFVSAKDSTAIYSAAPKTAGGISLGAKVNIKGGVTPRRLDEKLGYAGDGESKHVTVTLGTAWGFTDANHNLMKDGSGTPANVIVKADDKKIAAFYEVPFGDMGSSTWSNLMSYLDSGEVIEDCDEVQAKRYIGADGFGQL